MAFIIVFKALGATSLIKSKKQAKFVGWPCVKYPCNVPPVNTSCVNAHMIPDNLFAFPFISLSIAEGFRELEALQVIVPKVEAFPN